MKKTTLALCSVLMGPSLFGLGDYRCTDMSLCEIQKYTNVSSIDEAFTKGKVEGNIRFGYVEQNNHDAAVSDTSATAIGGQLKFETAKLSHISLGVSTYVSQKIIGLSGDASKGELNKDFFDENGDSFAYLGEAYVDYAYKKLDIRIGRQTLDTPLNDRDDIRMLPNTFEAAMVGYGGIEDTVLIGGYLSRWAGYDSVGDPDVDDKSKFKNLPGGVDTNGDTIVGVYLAGVMNESIENVELQAWYYDFDQTASVVYLDAIYAAEYESGLSVELGAQYGSYAQKSSSGIDGDVYGVLLALAYERVTLSAAYNDVESDTGNNIILGFGGGPYFTSMEEWTISAFNRGNAYVLGAEIDFFELIDGLAFSYAYGSFDDKNVQKMQENDFILTYVISDSSDLEVSYADVSDETTSGVGDQGYDRLLVRANYNF